MCFCDSVHYIPVVCVIFYSVWYIPIVCVIATSLLIHDITRHLTDKTIIIQIKTIKCMLLLICENKKNMNI